MVSHIPINQLMFHTSQSYATTAFNLNSLRNYSLATKLLQFMSSIRQQYHRHRHHHPHNHDLIVTRLITI